MWQRYHMTSSRQLPSLYDRTPTRPLPPGARIDRGPAAWRAVRATAETRSPAPVIVVEAYPGTDLGALRAQFGEAFDGLTVIDVERAALPPDRLDALLASALTDDRVFGILSHDTIDAFYDHDAVDALRTEVSGRRGGVVLVGWGAAHVHPDADVLVLVELPRWEIQQRYRAGAPNWHAANGDDDALRKYKRGFFAEWRTADRHKRRLFDRADFVADASDRESVAVITGDAFRAALAQTAATPFRLVPFFDPGVWGGQWMKRVCGLDDAANYAWCFDGVPEENGLMFSDGDDRLELPALDLVLRHPRELLGELTHARFGAEFPIRFDLLDTMGGGNLSLQVHPLTDYIRDRFGMAYTQDESYYLLDAEEGAVVYLGLHEGVDRDAMIADLAAAQEGTASFDAERYVNAFPARPHDHFSIPAGTVHCSGVDTMVLEISATPYIFTFKMWDWDRLGLDGVPRPIHLEHAAANIQWDRTTSWAESEILDQTREVASGPGWVEERTGLHELDFIEVRRHWFTGAVPHDTRGTVNVLNLVAGAEAVVESPSGAFAPFVVHYAETFIVPAAVGPYTIRPHGRGEGQRLATVKASVRGTERERA
jgi:mannose-6-phosphate isomerase class I